MCKLLEQQSILYESQIILIKHYATDFQSLEIKLKNADLTKDTQFGTHQSKVLQDAL